MDRLTAIKVFVAVADLGSLTAASDLLGMSRPMATRHVALVEQWLGVRLLHRSTRSLSLTPAGSNALPRCRRMLELAEDAEQAAAAQDAAPQGLIRVATSISFGQAWLAEAATSYVAHYPGTTVELVLSDQSVNLVEDRIDVAVRVTTELDPNLIARKLSRCRSVVCASPAYLARHGTPATPQDLVRHNCLNHTHLGGSWRFQPEAKAGPVDAALPLPEPQAITVSGNFAANDAVVILHATLAGAGIAYQPTYSAAPHLRSGALVRLLPGYRLGELGIYALYASRRHMPATTRTWVDFLASRLGTEPPWDAGL